MRFADFARSLEALEDTSVRIEMYHLLGGLFDKADAEVIAGMFAQRRSRTNKR